MSNKSTYEDYTPVDLMRVEPLSRHYYFVNKPDLMTRLEYTEYMLYRVEKRLKKLNKYHFEGRTETHEMKSLKHSKAILEEDIDYLKEIKRLHFDKKPGPKPSKRRAKRNPGQNKEE